MALLLSFCFSAAFLFKLVSILVALKCIFLLCAFDYRLTTTAPTSPSLEVSMAISIGAKCSRLYQVTLS